MAKRKVLKPFIFKGSNVVTDDVVEIDDARLGYFESQGLVGPVGGSVPEDSGRKIDSVETPVQKKAPAKRKKS